MLKTLVVSGIILYLMGCSAKPIMPSTAIPVECADAIGTLSIHFKVIDYYKNSRFTQTYKWDRAGLSRISELPNYYALSEVVDSNSFSISYNVESDSQYWARTVFQISRGQTETYIQAKGMPLGMASLGDRLIIIFQRIKSEGARLDHLLGSAITSGHAPPLTDIEMILVNAEAEVICSAVVVEELIYPEVKIAR